MTSTSLDFGRSRELLQSFEFATLFVDVLGWTNPRIRRSELVIVDGAEYSRVRIAEVSGVVVYEVRSPDGGIPGEKVRKAVQAQTAEIALEHLLIFVDGDRTQSYWYWVKRDGKKQVARHLSYYRGQSGDLILGKLSGLVFELKDFEAGDPAVVDVARRLAAALDVEKVTKKFYGDFKVHLEWFVEQIRGIEDKKDRRWYASIILNRLMFVYFLQYKGFVDGNIDYLRDKFELFEGKDFYRDFLRLLFFEGFAKSVLGRSAEAKALLGEIKYLNGGLFLEHRIEKEYEVSIGNEAFGRTLDLFEKYSWNLDDSPGGKDDEIRPEVLGYIFEKYINQKEFGAYYTRPEITEHLCDRTINKLILDKVNAQTKCQFESMDGLLSKLDPNLCLLLLEDILPKLSLLDPACGSGAFLVAAMKTLLNVYSAVMWRLEFYGNQTEKQWVMKVRNKHPSIKYFIKKRIITDNLYGVDIIEEATEITKLRLFLALVASATRLEELEPLPNVDFNVMAGNSLIGLVRVDESGFNNLGTEQGSLLAMLAGSEYRRLLEEKDRSIKLFKERAFSEVIDMPTEDEISAEMLKSSIEELNRSSKKKLNKLLFDEFGNLKIKYEEAQTTGKTTKRLLAQADIDRLEPFHWGYHFDKIISERGGFDVIIANPPWEVFKPNAKEFFAQYSDLVTKKNMDIKAFEKKQKELLQDPEIAKAWADYQSQFPYVNAYFRSTEQFKNQISRVNGRKAGTDTNLYKLFLELCFNLLKPSGYCGIIIPTGFYTDLGAKQLREMVFSEGQLDSLIGLSNEKFIFEGVDHRFKFCLLTFEKGGSTKAFDACFRIDPREAIRPNELAGFLGDKSNRVQISTKLVRQLSPDSMSVMEFRGDLDITIANKMAEFPLLGKWIDSNPVEFSREFMSTDDHHKFNEDRNGLIVYEGKMFEQFNSSFAQPQWWMSLEELKKTHFHARGDWQHYRFAIRRISSSTNERTLIASLLPKNSVVVHSIFANVNNILVASDSLYLLAFFNSFVLDFTLRNQVSANISKFYIHQLPVPRLTKTDRPFQQIVDRAAKLICTTPEFDDLAAEIGLGSHTNGTTDETERAKLRAELDGIIAHLYHLTEPEFTHILSTFPIVPQTTKDAALQAYRDLAPPVAEPEILTLLQQGESNHIEFKSTARWNLRDSRKDRTMEEVILKTIAAFLNTQGGTLLIGVADDSSIIGLDLDYQTLRKPDRDGFELWLMNDLLLKEFGKPIAPYITTTFHTVDQQDICKIAIAPAPTPAYINITDKTGQAKETFFIRTGNSTNKLDKPSEITQYISQHWT
jgi:hypothetical protein